VSLLHRYLPEPWVDQVWWGESVGFWHVSYCYVMIGSSHPLHTHTRSSIYHIQCTRHILYEVSSHMSVSLLHLYYHHKSLGQVWCLT
jgi:hypothetical protein